MTNKSNIHNLMSHVHDMMKIYPILHDIVAASEAHENRARYIAFRSGCVKANWFQKNYPQTRKCSNLKITLSLIDTDTAKIASRLEENMFRDISVKKEITGSKHFSSLEKMLPTILLEVAKTNSEFATQLTQLSNRLSREVEKINQAIQEINDEKEVKAPKKSKNELIGHQNATVENLINDVLATIDKRKSSAIRMLLARSDNKIATLQSELEKMA